MKLSQFTVSNFKNLESISFEWSDFLALIGENNCGKSSVLQALDWFLSGRLLKEKRLFRNEATSRDNAISLVGRFTDLTESEKRNPAIAGRIHEDSWILKKEYWSEEIDGDIKWKECYYSYNETEEIADWPESPRSWSAFPDKYNDLIDEVKLETGNARVTSTALDSLRAKIRTSLPEEVSISVGWNENPGGGGNWKSNANSVLPEFIYVPAVHEASSETQSKDATTYGKIINLIIEKKLTQREEIRELQNSIRRVKALFKPDPDHPEWGQAQEIQDLEKAISEKLSDVISARATIETTELNIPSLLLPATELLINDGYQSLVSGQGHGLQRTLIISLLQILNQYSREDVEINGDRSVIFAVEEAELYLHPQMVRKMKDVLVELSGNPRNQVICTTHSPVLIDLASSHQSIVRMEKDEERKVSSFQVCDDLFNGEGAEEKRKRLRMISEFDPSVSELFFAKRVVLVEGDTEIAALNRISVLESIFENPNDRRDVSLINCRGKGNLRLFMTILEHFEVNHVVVHDYDRSDDNENTLIQEAVGQYGKIVIFNPDFEGELRFTAQGKNKPIKALERIEELHTGAGIPDEILTKVRKIYGKDE